MRNEFEDVSPGGRTRPRWDMPSDHQMPAAERLLWRIAVFGPILAVPAHLLTSSPFPPVDTARHWLSVTGCPVARQIGTAPAKAGEPGYHARLDTNGNGIACEPDLSRELKGGGAARFLRPGD